MNTKRPPIESIAMRSSVAGAISLVVMMLQNIAFVPIYLGYWGRESYGQWISVFAFVTVMHSFTVGYQNYVGTEFNKVFHKDPYKAQAILGSGFKAVCFIAFVELIIVIGMWTTGLLASVIGETSSEVNAASAVVVLMICWFSCQAMSGVVARITLAVGDYHRNIYLGVAYQLGTVAVLTLASFCSLSILATSVVFATMTIVYVVAVCRYIANRMPDFFPWWKHGTLNEGLTFLKRAVVLSATGFMEQLNTNGITLLVAGVFNAAAVPAWTTTRTLANLGTQCSAIAANPMGPELARFHAKRDGKSLAEIIQASWLSSGFIMGFGFVLVSPFLAELYRVWTNNKIEFDAYSYIALVAAAGSIGFARPYTSYLVNTNSVHRLFIASVARITGTIGAGLLLVPLLQISGVAIAVCVGEILATTIIRHLARQELAAHGGCPTVRAETLTISVSLIMLATVISVLFFSKFRIPLTGIGLCLLTGLIVLQWRTLSGRVRERIFKLLRRVSGLRLIRLRLSADR